VPKGSVNQFRLRSRILGDTRRIWLYRPAGKLPSPASVSLVIFFDGFGTLSRFSIPTILDNLIHRRRIPPTVALFVDQRDGPTRQRDLACYAPFGRFLVRELLPWARRTMGGLPTPRNTALAGISMGGLSALYWATRHPDRFQRVLSMSGWFSWSPPGDDEPVPLAREFIRRPKLPLRIYMEVGRYEGRADADNDTSPLAANRHLRDILRLRGYPLQYREYCHGHDAYCLTRLFADAFEWVLSNGPVTS